MAELIPGSNMIPFSILNDDDFTRWMQPLLVYIVFYGRIPSPEFLDPQIRTIYHQVMERMVRGSFKTLVAICMKDEKRRLIFTWIRTIQPRRVVFESIRESWPEVVTHGLIKHGWNAPEHVAKMNVAMQAARAAQDTAARGLSMQQEFRPLQTYFLPKMQQAIRDASVADALAEFEKLTLQEVGMSLEEQVAGLTLQEDQSTAGGQGTKDVGASAGEKTQSDESDEIL